ncbi:MAG: polymer-forming cytoskeletal protein [Gammaproteobacteria bacterium]|nr:polymer-forming cytoskeletal protein [Gammaproteobacteria bacterium]MDH4313449.1 polymer-forming cytoskeletal protein [Gammaproteobacteria bacterium]MDH5213025.1 polymer-forming cytoskeletal protein [Gammaproteobacteria bacterium]
MGEFKSRRVTDRHSGPATLISESCKITGTLAGSGNFMVSGEIEGDCNVDGTLTLSSNGRWKGTIRARTVIIAGTIEGDIEASGNVEITDSARITGTVAGEAIAVAEGAVVQGVMKTTGRSEPVEFVEKRKSDE